MTIATPVYLDHNATTPMLPEAKLAVREACAAFGNPSSRHHAADSARDVLESGRTDVAALLGCTPDEVVFTSGGSEGANAAVLGLLHVRLLEDGRLGHIVTTPVEHSAVLESCALARSLGVAVTQLPVDSAGRVDPNDLRAALRPDTRLVSVMHANNETGVVQPLPELITIAHEYGVPVHTDAVQTAGKVSLDTLDADLLSVSAHKFYGPKGVGALRVRSGLRLSPLIRGGGQEHGRRAGTENLLGIAGMAAAARVAVAGLSDIKFQEQRRDNGQVLADRLLTLPGTRLNGEGAPRLPETVNVSFDGLRGDALVDLLSLQGVAASTGSACHAGSELPSHVLTAMGRSLEHVRGSVRFSTGRTVTAAALADALQVVGSCVAQLRSTSAWRPQPVRVRRSA